jgi:hypothetical protein
LEPDPKKRQPPKLSGGRLKWAVLVAIVVVGLLYLISDLIGGFGVLG